MLASALTDTYRLIIRFAVLTGLRRDEIALLQWGDLHLDAISPHILLRSSTVKNRKGKPHPVHPALIQDLIAFKPKAASARNLVFPDMPTMDQHRALLDAAGIRYVDDLGRYADFHSFRKSHGTHLYLAGVSQRTATEQMRLSSPKLLDDVYTDTNLLPTAEAVAKLNGYGEYTKKCDKILVQTNSDQSVPVLEMDLSDKTQPFKHEGSSPLESNPVPISQEVEESCRARTRTCGAFFASN
jgi:integrase